MRPPAPPDPGRTAVAVSGNVTTSEVSIRGARSKPTIVAPSGVVDVGHWEFTLVVIRWTVPVKSAAWLYRFSTPVRSDMKTIRRPSRVHTASPFMPEAEVKGVSVCRAMSQIEILVLP